MVDAMWLSTTRTDLDIMRKASLFDKQLILDIREEMNMYIPAWPSEALWLSHCPAQASGCFPKFLEARTD